MRFRWCRNLLVALAAATGLQCAGADRAASVDESLTIFVPDGDERALGPLKFRPWFLVREAPITYLHPRVEYLAAHRRVRGLGNGMEFFANVEHVWIEDD